MTTLQQATAAEDCTELVLRPPPRLQPREGVTGLLVNALPVLGSLGAILLVTTSGGGDRTRSWLVAGLFGAATIGFVVAQVVRQRGQRQERVGGSRRGYLAHLADARTTLRAAADRERHALLAAHPAPADLPAVAAARGGWPEQDRLVVRCGVAPGPPTLRPVVPPPDPGEPADPVSLRALERLVSMQSVQPGRPVLLDLAQVPDLEVRGSEGATVARALVASAAAAHDPDRLAVAVLTDTPDEWEWVKWLPHAGSRRAGDPVGPARMLASTPQALLPMLPTGGERHLLLVAETALDLPDLPAATTVLRLGGVRPTDPAPPSLRLELLGTAGGRSVPAVVTRGREAPLPVDVDVCDPASAEALARRLAAWRQGAARRRTGRAADVLDLLGLASPATLDPATAWAPRSAADRLRIPVGTGPDGRPVVLDLKESAEGGVGPHGLVVGATGSGKSELLRTLVLGLAATHSPDNLNLVLVDFKGGATFAGMASLPHVSAVITNLADELALVDRMQDALEGEMTRRQELLRASGNHASRRDHEQARAAGAELPPLPALLVVVDEFSELLAARPEFLDLFVAIGRLGRSLGIHLLLASQRLEEGRLRGLESHLSYRVGLRTFSAAESRSVLGVADAHELPAIPGVGYLRTDPTTLVRFSAAHVSGPPSGAVGRPASAAARVLPFTAAPVEAPAADHPPPPAPRDGRTTLDLAMARLAGHGTPAHRVWLPPLDVSGTLDALAPDLPRGAAHDPGAGLGSARWRARGGLVVPVGSVDLPRQQRRDPLVVDLSGAAGHVAVVGAPRSGKSTALRTIVSALALAATPLETQFYVLDLGGGAFAPFTDLPHVAGVAGRSEPDAVRRAVAEVRGVLDRREAWFREAGIGSVEDHRARRSRGEVDDGWGEVFLVVDGWGTLRSDFEELEHEIQQVAVRGLALGVHVVASATRWADFRTGVRDLFGTRLELRLGDPLDSGVDRRAAAQVPAGRPGRGLLPDGSHVLVALPRIDGDPDPATLADGVDDLVTRVADAWQGPAAPRLRLLPTHLDLAELTPDAAADRLLLGVDERRLAPVGLDVTAEPHLLVLGDGGSGKSATLRTYLREVVRTHGPDRAQVVLVDVRRSLLGEVPEPHLLHYLTSTAAATPALRELAAYLETRLPGPAATPEQLRSRSWWTGPEVFVVVDDHDLLATQQGSPVAALVPLMAQARDVGLHVVVARRSGGAARARFEPVLQAMHDLAQPGLLLPGNPDEGPLLGAERPAPGPPGRARLVTRDGGVQRVQVAWSEPST